MKCSRPIICKDCDEFKQAPNPELGSCTIEGQTNTTYYNSMCIYGLSETIETPEIETTKKGG
jgi:hypothetical protein